MIIRPLTSEEETQLKIVKDAANAFIKGKRAVLTGKLKYARKKSPFSQEVRSLESERNSLQLITGHPVVIKIGEDSIILDFDKLKKLDRLLNQRYWHRSARIEKAALIVNYQRNNGNKGVLEMYELPIQQTSLLGSLPVIEIDED